MASITRVKVRSAARSAATWTREILSVCRVYAGGPRRISASRWMKASITARSCLCNACGGSMEPRRLKSALRASRTSCWYFRCSTEHVSPENTRHYDNNAHSSIVESFRRGGCSRGRKKYGDTLQFARCKCVGSEYGCFIQFRSYRPTDIRPIVHSAKVSIQRAVELEGVLVKERIDSDERLRSLEADEVKHTYDTALLRGT